jgi:hypothetical protein
VRSAGTDTKILPDRIHTVWQPWPEVTIRTVLIAAAPWHLRIHVITTPFALRSSEGGWALDDATNKILAETPAATAGLASARTAAGVSTLHDFSAATPRLGRVLRPEPGSNVMSPRTLLPLLETEISAGTTRLACAVLGWPAGDAPSDLAPPDLARLLNADDEAFLAARNA